MPRGTRAKDAMRTAVRCARCRMAKHPRLPVQGIRPVGWSENRESPVVARGAFPARVLFTISPTRAEPGRDHPFAVTTLLLVSVSR
jgi:hypothetical protein